MNHNEVTGERVGPLIRPTEHGGPAGNPGQTGITWSADGNNHT
jgi:hypothetical protein